MVVPKWEVNTKGVEIYDAAPLTCRLAITYQNKIASGQPSELSLQDGIAFQGFNCEMATARARGDRP